MPTNSELHANRLAKVKQGLAAAGVAESTIQKVVGMYDRLVPVDAKVIADRTEFSVSFVSKMRAKGNHEARRQMTRAVQFLDDMAHKVQGAELPRKLSDAEFEDKWQRLTDNQLKNEVESKLASFASTPSAASVRLDVSVVKNPPPPAPKTPLSPELLRIIQDPKSKRAAVDAATRAVANLNLDKSTTSVQGALDWSNAKSELARQFSQQVNLTMGKITSIATAAEGACVEFNKLVEDAAAETEAKIALAKLFFGAVESLAPFPFSMVGKVGAMLCEHLHVDSEIEQTRQLGQRVYFNSEIPVLYKASQMLEEIKDVKTELTRLGLSTATLPSSVSVRDAIDQAKNRAIELLDAVFEAAIVDTFGGNPTDVHAKYRSFMEGVRNNFNVNMPLSVLPESMVRNKITLLMDSTKSTIEQTCNFARGRILYSSDQLQPFIELQLYSQYVAALEKKDGFDATIPDSLIARLESNPFLLIVRKSGSNQSQQIFSQHKLPWAAHPKHVGAVILFFRWYQKNVNPFDIAIGATTIPLVRDAMNRTITDIGAALQEHTITRRLRHDTADWAAVGTRVDALAAPVRQ